LILAFSEEILRIVYLSEILNIHDERFLQKLTQRGYDTWLITYYHEPRVPELIQRIDGLHIILWLNPHYARRFKIDTEYVSIESGGWWHRLLAIQGLWQCLRHFRKTLAEIRPDIVHAGWVYSSGLIAALSGFRPWLLMPWGSDVQVMPYQSYGRRIVARYVFRQADMITCDCQAVKNDIVRLSGYSADRIVIAPWGVDLHQFRPMSQLSSIRSQLGWEHSKILIVTRQLRSLYGIEYLISAMPRILAAEPQVRLLVCGDGPLEMALRNMVGQLSLESVVHFAGFVPNHLLPGYLNAADIYVSPSLEDGSSLSLMEAMACGLPSVVTDIPAVLEWVKHGHNGYVVPKCDVEGLASAVVSMLRNASSRAKMGNAALATAQLRADWDKNFRTVEEIYHHLVPQCTTT
jgi:L-malate glycosyltransferase